MFKIMKNFKIQIKKLVNGFYYIYIIIKKISILNLIINIINYLIINNFYLL